MWQARIHREHVCINFQTTHNHTHTYRLNCWWITYIHSEDFRNWGQNAFHKIWEYENTWITNSLTWFKNQKFFFYSDHFIFIPGPRNRCKNIDVQNTFYPTIIAADPTSNAEHISSFIVSRTRERERDWERENAEKYCKLRAWRSDSLNGQNTRDINFCME